MKPITTTDELKESLVKHFISGCIRQITAPGNAAEMVLQEYDYWEKHVRYKPNAFFSDYIANSLNWIRMIRYFAEDVHDNKIYEIPYVGDLRAFVTACAAQLSILDDLKTNDIDVISEIVEELAITALDYAMRNNELQLCAIFNAKEIACQG